MRRVSPSLFSTLLLGKSIQFLTVNSALLSSYIMVMKTVARSEETDPDLQLIKKLKVRDKFYTRYARLKLLACALACARYNRERSAEAADILL